ncbi:MAG TPA: hypothetical protein PKM25_01140, partial [Candidatus Ozemobacteraceae bacterium]|nr:hypothetical protein [Candidatus Ozemobacteraceae bacterium]
ALLYEPIALSRQGRTRGTFYCGGNASAVRQISVCSVDDRIDLLIEQIAAHNPELPVAGQIEHGQDGIIAHRGVIPAAAFFRLV